MEVIKREVTEDKGLDKDLEEDLVEELRHNKRAEGAHHADLFQSKCVQLK